ncbi:MAG: LacI family DNA-binding transcriptional regulator [Christensenellaceae bacterium]|nr:LacI family DNA-binding transcriptional regulator [Christensenellaceae bacterium]
MAVIKDVAKLAGLSVSAVSKYLNHPDHVKEDTKMRIEAAIRELNYVPSATARSMRTKRSNMIAVVVPDILDVFYTEVFNSIKYYAQLKGYTPILYTIENDFEVLRDYLKKISVNQFDGLMLCFLDEDELREFYHKFESEVPVVMFSGEITNNRFSAVATDVFHGGYMATKHLIDCGCRRIAYVGGMENSKTTKEKHAGYRKALQEAGLAANPDYSYYGQYRFETGYDAAKAFYCMEEMPDGIFAANDVVAMGFMKCMMNKGVKIPEDVKVIGFDNVRISSMYQPGISTIMLPVNDMCMQAVDMLTNAIEKKDEQKHTKIFKNELIIRDSTDKNSVTEYEK